MKCSGPHSGAALNFVARENAVVGDEIRAQRRPIHEAEALVATPVSNMADAEAYSNRMTHGAYPVPTLSLATTVTEPSGAGAAQT